MSKLNMLLLGATVFILSLCALGDKVHAHHFDVFELELSEPVYYGVWAVQEVEEKVCLNSQEEMEEHRNESDLQFAGSSMVSPVEAMVKLHNEEFTYGERWVFTFGPDGKFQSGCLFDIGFNNGVSA